MRDVRTQAMRDYADAVFRRAHEPMDPAEQLSNWEDRPSRYKTYPDAPLFRLQDGLGTVRRPGHTHAQVGAPVGLAHSLARASAQAAGYTLDKLASLLRLSYGVLALRTRVDWNHDTGVRRGYPAVWGRGTPSGGGLYPLEVYWVAGSRAPLLPGIYHYAPGHHALERLALGMFAGTVRAALQGLPEVPLTDDFLLVSARFRKNSFKYGSFSYHLVTQDLGALLGSWDLLGAELSVSTRRVLWFDNQAVNRMLDLATSDESVLAVVPLPWECASPGQGEAALGEVPPGMAAEPELHSVRSGVVTLSPFERSRGVTRFPLADRAHRATLANSETRPAQVAARAAAVGADDDGARQPSDPRLGPAIPLPQPLTDQLSEPVSTVVTRRRSSFGGFVSTPALQLAQLATVLSVAARAQHYRCDLRPEAEPVVWTGLSVIAIHVTGLTTGCYRYDATGHALRRAEPGVPERLMPDFLDSCHYLTNYNLEQVAAVLVISGRLDAMLSTYGARGYPILNAEAGSVAQAGYVAAAALGLGCGAVLGLDNVAIDEAIGLAAYGERSLLFVLTGHERPRRAELDFRLDQGGKR